MSASIELIHDLADRMGSLSIPKLTDLLASIEGLEDYLFDQLSRGVSEKELSKLHVEFSDRRAKRCRLLENRIAEIRLSQSL